MNVPHAAPPAWRPRAMFWGMMFTLVLIGGLAAIALALFATDWLDSNRLLGVSLHSPMRADYSADPRGFLVPAVNLNLIGEVLRQQPVNGAPVDPNEPLATVVVVLQTPVPTVTPQFAPTSGGPLPSPTEPLLPTATLGVGETPLATLASTATSRATATSTRPAASTATSGPIATQSPPTSTPRPPTATSAPPTQTAPAPTATSVQPSATPFVPTNTPVPPPTAVPPSATPDCGGGGYPAPPGCPTVPAYP